MLSDADKVIELVARLRTSDFYDPVHRDIFAAVAQLSEERKPIDLLTLGERLRGNAGVQAAGGSAYLAQLCTQVPCTSNADEYAAIVANKALQRAVADAGAAIVRVGNDEQLSGMEALEHAEQHVLAISRQSTDSEPQHIAHIGIESYDRYAKLYDAEDVTQFLGLRTGFADLDNLLTGFEPGAFIVIAARPSMGKTSLALNIARNAADLGKNVAFFSLEMTKQSLMDRIVAGILGVETWKLKKGELTEDEFRKLGPLFDGLKKHPLYIDDDPDTTIGNLRSKARRQQLKHGLDLLIIDYLQLIEVTDRAASENRTQQVTHISQSLKNLARELACPVIALSQLSRSVEQRNPAIPILSDLRESGSIEQDADIVLMLYRDAEYNDDCDSPGVTDVYIRKNRNGPTGRVSLFFQAERMSFTSLAKDKSVRAESTHTPSFPTKGGIPARRSKDAL
jgi:replicative DNA helicase